MIVYQEEIVKLSKREIELITHIEKSRRIRKTGALLAFLGLPFIWYGLPLIGTDPIVVTQTTAVLLGFLVTNLIFSFSNVRPDDKLIDVLQRYVNSDAEAIRQLSGISMAGGSATQKYTAL